MTHGVIQISESQTGPQIYFEECSSLKEAEERFNYLKKVSDWSMNQFLLATQKEFLALRKECYGF